MKEPVYIWEWKNGSWQPVQVGWKTVLDGSKRLHIGTVKMAQPIKEERRKPFKLDQS